jgi:hypothetical protein
MTKEEAAKIYNDYKLLSAIAENACKIYLLKRKDDKYDEFLWFDDIIDPYFYCGVDVPYDEPTTLGFPLSWLFIEDTNELDRAISDYVKVEEAKQEAGRLEEEAYYRSVEEAREKETLERLKKKYEGK